MDSENDTWLDCPHCESTDVELVQYKRPGEYVSLSVVCQACLAVGQVDLDFN